MRCSFCGAENIRTMEGVMRHHRRVLKRLSLLAGRRLVCRRVARYSVRSNSYVRVRAYVSGVMDFQSTGEILGRGPSRRDALKVAELRLRMCGAR